MRNHRRELILGLLIIFIICITESVAAAEGIKPSSTVGISIALIIAAVAAIGM